MKRLSQVFVWIAIIGLSLVIQPGQVAMSYSSTDDEKVALEMQPFGIIKNSQRKVDIVVGESNFDKTLRESIDTANKTTKVAIVQKSAESSEEYSLDQLKSFYTEAGAQFGIDSRLIEAVHQVESGKSSSCKQSYAGAVGPMQFLRSTFNHYSNGNICDAKDSIFAAASLLSQSGASDGDIRSALFSYNHSSSYVDKVIGVMESI